MPQEEQLQDLRRHLSVLIHDARSLGRQCEPPVIQEIVLAVRHAEDARLRLGVAEAYARGLDPWTNEVDKTNATN